MKFLASSGQINVSHELRADKSQLQAQYGQEEKRAEMKNGENERVCADNSQRREARSKKLG